MPISNDDLKEWENFAKECKKAKDNTFKNISDIGKKLIQTVKNNLKNKTEKINLNCEFEEKEYFLLEKGSTLGIDKLSDKKLRAGEFKIDYRLDLHGMTLTEAYERLKNLFEFAESRNLRCLLIITGKGLHSKDKTIKTSITDWFAEPYFSNRIIKYVDAHKKHGGSGALYVLLRNKDK